MGLEIKRLSDEETTMADAVRAQARIYKTTDGRFVGEGDPAGAFLAYGIGAEVPAGDRDRYDRFMKGEPQDALDSNTAGAQAYADDEVRDLMRRRQAGDPEAAAALNRGGQPALVHDRLATELADEARMIANADPAEAADYRNEVTPDGTVFAKWRVYRTDDGDLVHEGDPNAATLAYAVGDQIGDADVDEYEDLGEPEGDDQSGKDTEKDETKPAEKPAAKKAATPANKAAAKPADK